VNVWNAVLWERMGIIMIVRAVVCVNVWLAFELVVNVWGCVATGWAAVPLTGSRCGHSRSRHESVNLLWRRMNVSSVCKFVNVLWMYCGGDASGVLSWRTVNVCRTCVMSLNMN
jgi:hypothetical protein